MVLICPMRSSIKYMSVLYLLPSTWRKTAIPRAYWATSPSAYSFSPVTQLSETAVNLHKLRQHAHERRFRTLLVNYGKEVCLLTTRKCFSQGNFTQRTQHVNAFGWPGSMLLCTSKPQTVKAAGGNRGTWQPGESSTTSLCTLMMILLNFCL